MTHSKVLPAIIGLAILAIAFVVHVAATPEAAAQRTMQPGEDIDDYNRYYDGYLLAQISARRAVDLEVYNTHYYILWSDGKITNAGRYSKGTIIQGTHP